MTEHTPHSEFQCLRELIYVTTDYNEPGLTTEDATKAREIIQRIEEQNETLRTALESALTVAERLWAGEHVAAKDMQWFQAEWQKALRPLHAVSSPAGIPETGNCSDCGRPLTTEEAIRSDACPDCDPAGSPNGEQTREQLLERLALTVKEAIDGGSFAGTLFESQVSGTLWLLYGERSPAKERQ